MLAYFLLSPKATTRMLYLALSSITIGLFFLWKAFHFRREEEDFSQSQSGVKSPLPTPRIPSPKQVVSKASTPIPPRKQSFFTKTELEMSGTLYLDQKQSTRRLYKEQGKSLSPKAYSAIHHVGRGRLSTKGSTILVQSGNTSYHYPAADLDQIIFQREGIALLPHSSKQPAAIFLSKDANLLKEHIRSYSSES